MPGPKRRAVLAPLALAGGRVVTADQLVDALWPSAPPESGRATLHSHVSRLRGHLGWGARGSSPSRVATGWYSATPSRMSRGRARCWRRVATRAPRNPTGACAPLRAALALWRGPVLADLAEVLPLAMAAAALEQLRREVTDDLIACAIAAGQLVGVVALADEALATDPLREPAVLLLMHALAVTGRTAEALRTGARTGVGWRRKPGWTRRPPWTTWNTASRAGRSARIELSRPRHRTRRPPGSV